MRCSYLLTRTPPLYLILYRALASIIDDMMDNQSQASKLTLNPFLILVGIGKTVRKLRKEVESGSDEKLITVAKLSEKVYRKWRNELERKVELKHNPVRVKCDQVLKSD